MGVIRKILVFLVITSLIILLGKLAARLLPPKTGQGGSAVAFSEDSLGDSTNALPPILGDTSGGRWSEKLFQPLIEAYGLPDKSIKRKQGYWEIIFPKGKPIHEYALGIEKTCKSNGVEVVKGVELRPSNRGVEYHLMSDGNPIRLRASLGKAFMAGSARLAIVFAGLDSLKETQLAALESARWEKTLIINPHSKNPVLKKIRFTNPRNEVLAELPMEPSTFPYVDPGKQALFIHHTKEDVERILSEALDSLPKARGFATKHGDRAIENQPLLDKVFRFNVGRSLLFLDLTGSQRSLTRQTAGGLGARYRVSKVDKDSLGVAEELLGRAALAQKTGEALWVIAWSPTAFRKLDQALAEHEGRMSDVGLELVTSSRLSGRDGLKSAADAPKPRR